MAELKPGWYHNLKLRYVKVDAGFNADVLERLSSFD